MLSLVSLAKKVRDSSPNSRFFPSDANAAWTSLASGANKEGNLGEMCSTNAPTKARCDISPKSERLPLDSSFRSIASATAAATSGNEVSCGRFMPTDCR